MKIKIHEKTDWIMGGTTLIGVGIGCTFLETSIIFFLASILIGIGLGFVLAPIFSKK